jgi:hypothetical protein
MTDLTEREQVIKTVYENVETGYGSVKSTLEQAKKINSLITYNDVKTYLDKLQHRQTQFLYKSYNSYVSKHALFDMEIDLMDMTEEADDNNGYRYGFVAIDTFTKMVSVIAIKTKQPADVMNAMEQVFKILGIPKQIYSDQEGSFTNVDFVRLMNKHKIKHIMTVGSAHFVENYIRQFKEKIQTRLNAMKLSRDKWIEHIKYIVDNHNNSYHSVIKMTPKEATKQSNHFLVKWNILDNATYERKYPKISVSDNVRVLQKKTVKTKGYFPKWSEKIYKVITISNGSYMIDDPNKRKLYRRHELLKVN